jgi:thiol-disulfide isomerase/thioredoxin
MRTILPISLIFTILISCSTQTKLPQELKGNWLNANDSIEWIISLQPDFAVYDNKFWDYKSISGSKNHFRIKLTDGNQTIRLKVELKDSLSLKITGHDEIDERLTRKKAARPDFRHYDMREFENLQMVDDTVTIRGFIEDYDPDIYDGTGGVYHRNVFSNILEEEETKFNIDTTGRFEVRFRAYNFQIIYLVIEGSTMSSIIIQPGHVAMIGFNNRLLEVTNDARKWETLTDWQINHYMGEYGLLSEELIILLHHLYHNSNTSPLKKFDAIDEMSQMEYIGWRKEVYSQETAMMDSLILEMRNSKKAEQCIHGILEIELLHQLYRYQISGTRFQYLTTPYIGQIPEMHASSLNLINTDFLSYLNYLNIFYKQQPLSISSEDIGKYRLQFMLSQSKSNEEQTLIKELIEAPSITAELLNQGNIYPLESSDYDLFLNKRVAALRKPYNELWSKYWEKIPDSIHLHALLKELDFVLDKHNKNLISQLYAAYCINRFYENNSPGPELNLWITNNIDDPILKKLSLENHKKEAEAASEFADYAKNTFFISQIKSGEEDDAFFNKIIQQFRGKVIYIDFWADWCSPCRAGFKPAARLKKEYAGKDVVFLYFGYNCKNERWDQVIKQDQVSGYHYWLDKEQGKVLKEKFGIIGIPHYLLVDRNGEISAEQAPDPGNRAAIRERLDELLK